MMMTSITTTTKSSTTILRENNNPFAFIGDIFNPKQAEEAVAVPQYEPVTIDNDFRVAGLFLVVGGLFDFIPYLQVSLGPILTVLGLLFLVQGFLVTFQFNENNELELLSGGKKEVGENKIVGGANVWSCDTIVNYDFFPPIGSSPIGPILVYFKETQTPSEKWNEGPGASANNPEKIASGVAVPGQVHFFPAVCNAEQICEEFEKRQCGKL
mmetsp:Transcript_55333/g.59948  ORF Transcript_55333/g.59948 Transcript_55333/m.59948 type:complete len:212 (+) Transcript_55333:28-663(+)